MEYLTNTLATPSQLASPPSRADGIDPDLERRLRFVAAGLVQEMGVQLRLRQEVIAHAMILLQRFYFVASFAEFAIQDIALAVTYLSSKLNETQKSLRDCLNVQHYMKHYHSRSSTEYIPPDYFDQTYYSGRERLLECEMEVLKRLGFKVQVALPYSLALSYARVLNLPKSVFQRIWNTLSDVNRGILPCIHDPAALACGSIWLVCRGGAGGKGGEKVKLPPGWWELFDVENEDLGHVVASIEAMYAWVESEKDTFAAMPWDTEGLRRLLTARDGLKENVASK
ncbi:cyclin-like protein [Saitoella complicata NRRL Y-17804]|uniref:Cyclin-like domain-containing protein n=1 Tax=Saitoella complicata (strain BCRC 22490 / CBS 7301 / JCM 7358 / NBRC 10748 / NRRL Y-17804) TaxID=698492 RepID=A0A0E9NED9_SAICN|nr:cyclin-like protein [Saitoella complicata NRRL Y-17804]ODQ54616.1 cyclin-like protein [Saitoella complicata NRRL Y-17804]GAO48061.1 hypothetical protein G7K_2249-t1 [Saitoella complicata NRRL Y-17804]